MRKTDSNYRRTKYTYAQLHRVLSSLGFSFRKSKEEPVQRIYEHKPTGEVIMFAYYPDKSKVVDYHLGMTQATMQVYGIANLGDFFVELDKAS